MGTSTDGLLWYGYCWDDEGEIEGARPPWDEDEEHDGPDVDDFLAARRGLVVPTVEYGAETKPIYEAYWKEKRAAENAAPCEIVRHCHIEVTMYGVAVKASLVCAERGGPKEIEPRAPMPEWDAQLADFMRLLGVETKQSPRWWLASYWD